MVETFPMFADNPWLTVLSMVVVLLIGFGGRGFITTWRQVRMEERDKVISHQRQVAEDLREQIGFLKTESRQDKEDLRAEIASLRATVETQNRRNDQLQLMMTHANTAISETRRNLAQYEARVIQLEEILKLNGVPVPPWTLLEITGQFEPLSFDDLDVESGGSSAD